MATSWDERNAQTFAQQQWDKSVPKDTPVHLVLKDKVSPTIPTNYQPTDRQTITEIDPRLVLKDNEDKHVPKSSKKKPQKPRAWLKVRLPADQDRALNIVENWRLEKQAAPKVAAAIQLYAALEVGDVDYVRENCPKMIAALEKSLRKKATLSLKESDSYTERESAKSEEREPAVEQIAETIQTITGRDRHLNPDVYALSAALHSADYTPADLQTWYQRFWPHDWRAVKAAEQHRIEQPTLKVIRECIGKVRSLPRDEPEPEPDEDWNPFAPVDESPEAWPPEGCNGGKPILDPWLATMGQLEIQLNRATYDTWLRHAAPVHFAGDRASGGTLYVSVPHHYAKDWIDRYLLPALNKTFDDIANYSGEKRRRISEDRLFEVAILVEGDPVPLAPGANRT